MKHRKSRMIGISVHPESDHVGRPVLSLESRSSSEAQKYWPRYLPLSWGYPIPSHTVQRGQREVGWASAQGLQLWGPG